MNEVSWDARCTSSLLIIISIFARMFRILHVDHHAMERQGVERARNKENKRKII